MNLYLVRVLLAVVVLLMVAALPFGYRAIVSTSYRNFRVVKEGMLYRSGQMSVAGFKRICRERGIKTIIKLRESSNSKDADEERAMREFCAENDIAFPDPFPQADWSPVNGSISGHANLRRFVQLMGDPTVGKPVLVHCFAGIHRTGPLVAAYRIEYEGWTPDEAASEMTRMGTARTTFADNLLDYFRNYRLHNPPRP